MSEKKEPVEMMSDKAVKKVKLPTVPPTKNPDIAIKHRKDFDYDALKGYLSFRATTSMCSALLGVSERTVERKVREKYDLTVAEYREKCLAPVKLKLVNKAISMAMGGDRVLLIFCLKNLCGWADVNDKDARNVLNVIQLNYKLD